MVIKEPGFSWIQLPLRAAVRITGEDVYRAPGVAPGAPVTVAISGGGGALDRTHLVYSYSLSP